jgi:two-component system, NarL family, response regulator NreC
MRLNILMVDDHPLIVEGYRMILSYNNLGYEIETTSVYNCQSAYEIITDSKREKDFDIIFLDYNLPAYEEKGIKNGEDLAMLVKKHWKKCKIVILTSHNEAIILYTISRNIEPLGLLIKSDFTAEELITMLDTVVKGKVYYSNTVKNCVEELLSKKIYLDTFNRQIISLLAQGVKTKSLPNYINLSISAIEKRKVQIRDYFCIQKGNDEDIIREAKKLGLI